MESTARRLCLPDFDQHKAAFTRCQVLGRGQFSIVHKAFDRACNRFVALKVVCLRSTQDEKTRADCIKEIHILQNLHHPNIIQLLAAYSGRHGEDLVLVLQLADQGDLASVIDGCRSNGVLLAEAVVRLYVKQILHALQYLHANRILHRDIKPSNIFIHSHLGIKLGDLGFSRLLSPHTTSADSFLGTPYYMSPERLKELKYSFPSDIWSVGCVFYEMVALQPPFYSKHISLNGLCKRIESGLYPPSPSVLVDAYSPKMTEMIQSCLIPNPGLRPTITALICLFNQN